MAIKQKNNKNIGRNLLRYFIVSVMVVGIGIYAIYNLKHKIFAPNVVIQEGNTYSFYIPTGATYSDVSGLLEISGVVKNLESFNWLAEKKGYPEKIKPGHYVLKNGMNNNELVNMFRGGLQTPVRLTFSNVRTKQQLAGIVSNVIEADSASIATVLSNDSILSEFGFDTATVYAMIIPNTYEMWWNSDALDFLKRMHREFNKFWTDNRLEKAKQAGLSPIGVATLASIVDEETVMEDEKKTVAGLYINRLKRNMRLQADPTIKFVLGDFSINRVLSKDLKLDSPYNTYLYAGLPPGPIRFPSVKGIEAVLNFEKHNYLYMCAKDDFSGYHNFAKTLRQHNINAARYRRALRQRRIWR
ncbi:endolytic transglycosylase MltG [Thermophagus sp. OGC60D27]|uniref:endolytic transglycosylase MltG n=1 Tax=Thermophagus sp. OGC60D27 TaxID=3458415 RepID=UPI004037DBF5